MKKVKQVILIYEDSNGKKSYWGSNWNGFIASFKEHLRISIEQV